MAVFRVSAFGLISAPLGFGSRVLNRSRVPRGQWI